MAEEKIRMQIRISKVSSEKLGEMADRYGMSANSLVSYIVGQWLDNNYDLKDHVRAHMMQKMDDVQQQMMNNPLELMKWKELLGSISMMNDDELPLFPTEEKRF